MKISQPRDYNPIVEKDVQIPMRDGIGSAPYTHFHADYNAGAENMIYAGGETPSYLLLPVIPPIKSQAEIVSAHATEPIR